VVCNLLTGTSFSLKLVMWPRGSAHRRSCTSAQVHKYNNYWRTR